MTRAFLSSLLIVGVIGSVGLRADDWPQWRGPQRDGNLLATGSGDQTLKLWNVATQSEVATLRGHRSGVTAVVFAPDGKSFASAGVRRDPHLGHFGSGIRQQRQNNLPVRLGEW